MRTLDEALGSLDRISKYKSNWDSYGSPEIDREIIAAARRFIESLAERTDCCPTVVPMSNGSIQLEWHSSSKTLELEFETPEDIWFLQWEWSREDIASEGDMLASDINRAVELIEWFLN